MQRNYDESEKRVLSHEGGYTNEASDPGGPTNWGITIYDARLYWKKDATASDVRSMPLSVAKDIYRDKYWAKLNCDRLPDGVDYACFDYGVNSGVGRAGKVLRRLVGLPDTDWQVTSEVIDAVSKRDQRALVDAICDERLKFLKGLAIWGTYGHGWSVRVAEVRVAGKEMVSHAGVIAPVTPPVSQDTLAVKLKRTYDRLGYFYSTEEGALTLTYAEGMDPDGRPNDNRPNVFNDSRILWSCANNTPKIEGIWEATTEPGRYWTEKPMNEGGAAHIALGQQTAWVMGTYHDAPALRQARPIKFTRDPKGIFKRYGEVFEDDIGVHHHAGYNYPHDDLGRSSAGCQVGRSVAGHLEFIKLLRTDPRYQRDKGFVFTSAVVPADEILKTPAPVSVPVPKPQPLPSVSVPADPPQPKGKVTEREISDRVSEPVGGVIGATGVASAGYFWHWVAAHPYETFILAVFVLALGLTAIHYITQKLHPAKQEAPVPGVVPVPATK